MITDSDALKLVGEMSTDHLLLWMDTVTQYSDDTDELLGLLKMEVERRNPAVYKKWMTETAVVPAYVCYNRALRKNG